MSLSGNMDWTLYVKIVAFAVALEEVIDEKLKKKIIWRIHWSEMNFGSREKFYKTN